MTKNILTFLKDIYTKYKLILSLLIMLLVFAMLAYYVKTRSADFNLLYNICFANIVGLSLSSIFFRIALGYNFYILMLFFNIKLLFREWLGLTTIATMTNYLVPAKGGTAAQAVYLKNVYGLGYSHYLSSTIGCFIITFMVNACVGLALSIIARSTGIMTSNWIILFFAAVTIIVCVSFILVLMAARIKINNSIFKNIIEGLGRFYHKRNLVVKLIISQFLVIIAIGLRLLFAFKSIGIEVNITACIIVALFTSFFIFLSLTPANLGIKEFFITLSSTTMGVTPAQGLAVALIDRGFDIIVSFIGGASFSFVLAHINYKAKPVASGKDI
jgi:uncharacterized membrane protein YbhN (UPF0104 family)